MSQSYYQNSGEDHVRLYTDPDLELGKHNYQDGKSIFDHNDAAGLLEKYAGKGMPVRGKMGDPGYREVVDFGENIGAWKSKDGTVSLNTMKGTIHYSKKGAHIVPEHPDKKLW